MRVKIVIGVVVLAFAVVLAVVRVGGLQGGRLDARVTERPAPGFMEIEAWLNSEPLTLEQLAGDVVLVDFWTYTCINCVRTFPFLRALHEHYGPAGLRIVGVHSPEFRFERDIANVRAEVERHELTYPVALDNEMATWRAYRNNYWPRVYLIDAEGSIRFDHIGEGGEDRIEGAIRDLLLEAGSTLPPPLRFREEGPSAHITPEIYAGFERGGAQGSLGNSEGYRPGRTTTYAPVQPGEIAQAGTNGVFFLEGAWRADAEYVEASADGATLTLPFRARNVFVVATPASGDATARLMLDGRPVEAAVGGDDVADATVTVARAGLFSLLRLDEPASHVLTIEASAGLRIFTFTFG